MTASDPAEVPDTPTQSGGHVRVWVGPKGEPQWSVTVHVGTAQADVDASLAIALAAAKRLGDQLTRK